MIHTVIDFPINEGGMYSTEDHLVITQSPQMNLLGPSDSTNGTNPLGLVPPALEKTRMCVYYLQGRCKYDDCSFAHSVHELKQAPSNLRKTKLCDLFMMGHCYDLSCNFAHSTDELKVKPKRTISLGGASSTLCSMSGNVSSNSNGILSPRSNVSSGLMSASVQRTHSNPSHFDRETYDRNTESCARTILSMLIKMQPEAAVAFLSNPECKAMLEKLLSKSPNTYTVSSPISSRDYQSSNTHEKFSMDMFGTEDGLSTSNSTLNTSGCMFSTPSSCDNSLIENFAGSFFVNDAECDC